MRIPENKIENNDASQENNEDGAVRNLTQSCPTKSQFY